MSSTIQDKLFGGQKTLKEEKQTFNKISVCGCGEVGCAVAYTLVTQVIKDNEMKPSYLSVF